MACVLFVSHSSEMHGAEKSLELFLRRVDKTILQPVVAMPGKGPLFGMISRLGLPVYDVPMHWWVPPSNYPPWRLAAEYRTLPRRVNALCDIARRHRCQAVHTNSLVVVDGALAASLEGLPHVWHVREDPCAESGLEPVLGWAVTLNLTEILSERVVAVSHATRRWFNSSSRVEVIYNGVELEEVPPAILPGKPDSLKVAFVGNFTERKGPDLFVKACLRLEGVEADFYLVGEHSDKGVTSKVNGLLEGSPNRDRFHLLGFRPDAPAVLSACDIYVLSSRDDPFPRTVLEAMAAGCAVVVTDCGGAPEAVRACSAGEVVEIGAEAIVGGLNRLIRNPDYMCQCRESARSLVREKFSAASYVARLCGLLQETAAMPRSESSLDKLLRDLMATGKRTLVEELTLYLKSVLRWNFGRK